MESLDSIGVCLNWVVSMRVDPITNFEATAELGAANSSELLRRQIADLDLQVEGTRVEKLVHQLYGELEEKGIVLRPRVYFSDEWGCPDGVPIIGVPFYLADESLTRIEDEMTGLVEAESDEEILRYLRHETGHAFNYAHKLYESREWNDLFGPFARPYTDAYSPHPFSHDFVRHLPGWYAQKHPDDDFAETFAVWLTPGSDWQNAYATWGCFEKLLYVDNVAKAVGQTKPLVSADEYDVKEEALRRSLGDHYQQLRSPPLEIPPFLDGALRDIFRPRETVDSESTSSAAVFIRENRRAIQGAIVYWTGLDDVSVRSILEYLIQRCEALKLHQGAQSPATLVQFIVFVTALCMNKLFKGEFVGK